MRNFILMVCAVIGLVALISCSGSTVPGTTPLPGESLGKTPGAAPVKAGWELEMQQTAEAAKKEGTVVVYMTAGASVREALVKTFGGRYGVSVEAVSLTGPQLSEKLIRERRAGLYLGDVYQGGVTTPITGLKPLGIFDPLEPAFILPELKDPELIKQTWWDGKLLWVDNDHKVIAFGAFAQDWVLINTDLVKPEELRSLKDLLNPKWKGKVLMYEPSMAGAGSKLFGVISEFMLGLDFWREFARQEPVILRDHRQMVEWVAQKKYSIAVAPRPEESQQFKNAGAPVLLLPPPVEGIHLTAGSGGLALINQAAHPNAAKLYINWILSKEGLTTYTRAYGSPGARLDVPTDFLPPDRLRQPGVKYFWADYEGYLLKEAAYYYKEAREIFGIR